MMTPMRYHPVPGAPERRHGFGFEHVMREPDYRHFRAWYDRSAMLPILGAAGGVTFQEVRDFRLAA